MGYITNLSRELRKHPTLAEDLLWQNLRGKKRLGKKFLRQYPFVASAVQGKKQFFIADFYCDQAKLVVEVDGGYHLAIEQSEHDRNRDKICGELGLRVLRIKNEEVENNMKEVLRKIDEALAVGNI